MSRVVVVAPLKEGMRERALELVRTGPPFEPATSGLARHSVHVSEREAVFVFDGTDARAVVESLVGDPAVWRAASAWRECLAGRPRLAEEAFVWERSAPGAPGRPREL